MVLGGIFGNEAIIGDDAYKVGQKVNGWTIKSVLSDQVVLYKGGKKKVLKLEEE